MVLGAIEAGALRGPLLRQMARGPARNRRPTPRDLLCPKSVSLPIRPEQLPEWKAVDYGTAAIIKGWERHLAAAK